MKKINNIVVNWHILESCQLKCKYCYAEWNKEKLPLIFKDKLLSIKLIKEISILDKHYESIRLSFAGGEPLLDKNLTNKISYAYQNNMKISIITNGDLLTKDFLKDNCLKLDILGVSIDSINNATNLQIGRATLTKRIPNYENIIQLLNFAKKINPNIKIKINTVVNRFNFNESMLSFIQSIHPYKWKILKVLPSTDKAKAQIISDDEFKIFTDRHKHLKFTTIEDNSAMLNSYIMIDPYGRFFYNNGENYNYSKPILDVGIEAAFKEITFNDKKFIARY